MYRLIVTSATYRQSSRMSPELMKRDPQNVLLARGPRFRVESEVVRDIALAASGLLNEQVGGPSVFPPQPPGISELSYGPLKWVDSVGPDRYRRGMYTYMKRTAMYPAEITFDGPTAEVTCPRHGARFSVVTGEALSPPAYEPVGTFQVRVEQGIVQVRTERAA